MMLGTKTHGRIQYSWCLQSSVQYPAIVMFLGLVVFCWFMPCSSARLSTARFLFQSSIQISPDAFRVWQRHILCNDFLYVVASCLYGPCWAVCVCILGPLAKSICMLVNIILYLICTCHVCMQLNMNIHILTRHMIYDSMLASLSHWLGVAL